MKPNTNYLHVFLWLVLCLPCSIFASDAAINELISNGEKIVRSNWPPEYMGTNLDIDIPQPEPCPPGMGFEDCIDWVTDQLPPRNPRPQGGGSPCIQRDNNGDIKIKLSYAVYTAVYAQSHPNIYLRYTVGGDSGILSPSNMGSFVNSAAGTTLFAKTVTMDLSSLQAGQLFQYTFELLTKDANNQYIPYPVDDHPDLFVEYIEIPNPWDNDKTIVTGWKPLCGGLILPSSPLQSDNSNRVIFQESKLNPTTSSISTTDIIDEIEVKAYPNPFTNQLTIKGNITENSTLQLFDIQGKLIYYEELVNFAEDSSKMIDTSSFPLGMYYCQIKNIHSSQTIKVVKR